MGSFRNAKKKAMINKNGNAVDSTKPRLLSISELVEELGLDEADSIFNMLDCIVRESDIVFFSDGDIAANLREFESSSKLTKNNF